MKKIVEQILIAAVTATIVTLVLVTPDIITQLIVFIPVFALTFGVLRGFAKRMAKKK